jgi:hypothetical protein
MRARDVLAAICVAAVWGLTFIAIKIGVGETMPSAPLGPFEIGGAVLVMAGLGFTIFGDRLLRRRRQIG